jgi:hypothetical protein
MQVCYRQAEVSNHPNQCQAAIRTYNYQRQGHRICYWYPCGLQGSPLCSMHTQMKRYEAPITMYSDASIQNLPALSKKELMTIPTSQPDAEFAQVWQSIQRNKNNGRRLRMLLTCLLIHSQFNRHKEEAKFK